MSTEKDHRIAELEAELKATKRERDEYLLSAQSLNKTAEKLMVLDDYRLQNISILSEQNHAGEAEPADFEPETSEDDVT